MQYEALTPHDLAMLKSSFITPELAEQAGLFRVDSLQGAELVGRNGRGDHSGIAFPYFWPGEHSPREYRLRRDHPDLEQQADGSIKEKGKYLSPPGRGNILYFAPGPPPSSLKDSSLPLIITEGEKKALALYRLALHDSPIDKPRFLPIGLAGVWNWRGRVGKTLDAHGERRDVKGVIADFDRIAWSGRIVYIIFDTNVATHESVREARHGLAKELTRRKAEVRFVELPQIDDINGVDDLLALKGPNYILALMEAARTPDQQGHTSLTPAKWFADRFPSLVSEFGDAILEQTDKNGIVSAQDINEDFLATTLGEKASPDTPTVCVPTEAKFYTYSPIEGVFTYQREPVLQIPLSRLLLDCARACKNVGCDTRALEFRFRDSASLSGVLRKARGLLEVGHHFFSTDLTEFIPCANGMLRLSDKALLPFNPSYRRRNKLAVPFEATATCPLFVDTLMRPALDQDDLDLLQRWCGLALIGENLAQKLLVLTGTPGGGKGTFIRVLNGIIGQINLASLRPQLLGERFELGRFLGKTLLYGADVPENFLNQRGASVLKSLTGYDPMTLEFKNSNESPFIVCKFNVIVTCNSRLTVHLEGDTEAWRRRLVIIDYHKPKPNFLIADLDQRILSTEAPGVLNWMLEGLHKLRADGWQLYLTPAHQKSVDNLLLESDSHAWFVREQLVRGKGQLTVQDCFAAYVEYCNERGWVALGRNKFGRDIEDVVTRQHGVTLRHDIRDANGKAQRGWNGLRLDRELSISD